MATALPAASAFTGAAVTEGDFKSAITALHDFLSGMLGTDGATPTALTTLGAALSGILTKSAAYAVVAGDKGKLIDCTGTWSLSALAAATAGNGFTIAVRNSGSGVITFDPNLTETVDGGATLAINAGESLILYCDGTKWLSVGSSSGVPSGALMPFAGHTAPAGWLLCYGQAVSRTTYVALFNVLGTTYGVGDGSTTYNLPDMRGRVPAGKDNMGGSAANRLTYTASGVDGTAVGAVGGAETVVLTAAQCGLPPHSHAAGTYSVTGPIGPTAGSGVATTGNGLGGPDFAVTGTSAATGGWDGAAHNNAQPTMITNYIIKT